MRSPAMDSRDALKLHIPGKETPTQQDVNPQLLRLPSNGAVSPSSPPVLTVEELAQDEARMQQFLTSNYHLLCKRIFMSLDLFFSWLRSCGIFTIHDQELVEHTYPIKLDKAGHLIDIITYNKGSAGFKAFMEVIEYEFPYVFTHIMGRKPGKPPPEYRGSVHMEGSIKQHSRTFWDQASEDMEKVTSRVNGEIMQRFKAMALRAQETERMTLNSLQEEIVTLREEKVNLESLAAKYRLERDEGCAKCRQFQQQKDVSNKKVVELSQQVNQQQTELSRLKSGHWENDVRGSLKAPQKDDLLKKIQHMIDENSSAQEHHDKEVQEQLEQLKHERDHLYNLWQQEKGKREHAFIECSYYLEKSKQLENEMKQLIDVAYTSPRDRACNLKDRKDLPSVISKKLVTPSTEVPTSFFANDVDTGFVDIGSDWNGLTRHKTHLLFRHPQSMVETERSTFRQHPSATGDHRRSAYLSPFPIQVMQKFLDTTLLVPRLSFRGLASETVEVDADLLRRHITLVGGSYTGIFVDDIGKANDPCTSLTVGDQILKMGQSVQDMYYIDGMTLEQVLLLLKRFSGPVTLCKLSNISGLGKLHNARENHEIIHGDCFCVVIEKTIASNDADWLSLERGNIVMVTETVHGATWNCKSCWFGVKLNHKNANLLQSGCLPSEQKQYLLPDADVHSPLSTFFRLLAPEAFYLPAVYLTNYKGAPQYVYVHPYKACYQRPVVVFSPDNLAKSLHEALLKLSDLFFPYQTDHLFRCEMDEVGEEMVDHLLYVASKCTQHLLLTVREEDLKCMQAAGIYPIVLVLQYTPSNIQNTAGKQQEEQVQKVFYRHEYEVMSMDQSEADDLDGLAGRVEKQVQMMQMEVIWIRCSKATAPF